MMTFHNLKRLGLLNEKEHSSTHAKNFSKIAAVANIPHSSNFRSLAKKLHLVSVHLIYFLSGLSCTNIKKIQYLELGFVCSVLFVPRG